MDNLSRRSWIPSLWVQVEGAVGTGLVPINLEDSIFFKSCQFYWALVQPIRVTERVHLFENLPMQTGFYSMEFYIS